MCLTPAPFSVFFMTLLTTFPHRIQVHSLLQMQPPLQPRRCNRPSLPPKSLKILNGPIHQSSHFSVRTHLKGTLQPKLGSLIYLQDQYLSTTSNVSLSPTQSPNIKKLFKSDTLIGSGNRITVMGDRAFTNTLQD